MILRSRAGCRSVGLTVWLLMLGLGTAPSVPAAEPEASRPAAERWHRQLDRLDQEIAHRWDRVQRARGLSDRGAPNRPREEARGAAELRRRLELLELRIHGLPEEQSRPLRAKARSLGRSLDNLELALAGRTAPPVLSPSPSPAAATGRPEIRALTAPASNSCTAAPTIGDGTFTGTTVGATNDGTATCGSSSFSPDVWFRYVAPADGLVSMDTFGSGFDTVLSLHAGCSTSSFLELRCNDDASGLQSAISFTAEAGVSYWVRISGFNSATGPFELHVGTGGALSGTVTEAGSGTPVTVGEVSIHSLGGFFLQSVPLGADGTYTVGGLRAGVYPVRTVNEQGLRDEVWDDHPCTGRLLCDFEAGDPVAVESQDTTVGIDFSLAPGGEIAGTVRRAENGDPAAGVRIEAWTVPDVVLAAATVSAADGSYSLSGLGAGSYWVVAESPEFTDELYDDVTCPGGFEGFNTACDAEDGAAVAVTLGSTTSGIDFDLERLGILEGAVTEAGTGLPIEGVMVEAIDATFGSSTSTFTDETGAFRVAGLAADNYFLKATDFDLLPEVYQEAPCPRFCNVLEVGTSVPLALEQVVSGLDFTLEPYGSLSGTVTDAVTADPFDGNEFFGSGVLALAADGSFGESNRLSATGTFQINRLPAGQYFVRTDVFNSPYLDELYDDLPCYGGCDETSGSMVAVAAGSDTPGIDFALDRGGTISGAMTDALTGEAVGGSVTVYDLEGDFVGSGFGSFFSGLYTTEKLAPGSYLVEAEPSSGFYVDQLYDRVSCFQGLGRGCEPEQGTPVAVALNTEVTGIDFPLVPMGTISGRVTDATNGEAVDSASVEVRGLAGDVLRNGSAGPDGSYTVDELPPGEYLVRTTTGGFFPVEVDFVDEVFDDQPCDGSQCDFERQVALGTPVAVTGGADTPDIDFDLFRMRSITGRVFDVRNGAAIANQFVLVLDGAGFQVDSARTDFDGTYRTDPLKPGVYGVLTAVNGFLDEAYDDIPCSGSDCRSNKGTPVTVSPAGDTTGIDFGLEPLDSGLVGTVLDGTTRLPLAGVAVQIWDAAGEPVIRRTTRANGVWFADLAPGTYFVSTDAGLAFPDQVYLGVFCDGPCDPLSGTPLTVPPGLVIRGVDFRLSPLSIFTDGFESGDVSRWSLNR